MNTTVWKLVVGALACSLQGEALAFRMNPCLRVLTVTEIGLSEWQVRAWNGCGIAPDFPTVHEHMTLASVSEYRETNGWIRSWTTGKGIRAWRYMQDPPWHMVDGVAHQTYGLVYGVWWNDDPLMYMTSANFASGLDKFDSIFDGSRASYPGRTAGCKVPASMSLPRISHYGALQHLHFMTLLPESSSAEQRIDATLEGAWTWMKFAYGVATKAIEGASRLTPDLEQRLSLPPIWRNSCLMDKSNARVRTLFTTAGPAMAENLAARDSLAADVALGTMLHIMQDSFSPAHTCRVLGSIDGKPAALLSDVYNFNEQNEKAHKEQDLQPAWLINLVKDGTRSYSNDPVTTGAWLLGAVDNRLPWSDVRAHLEKTVFARATPNQAGPRQCLRAN